jgi:hypothetical protein
VNPPGGGGGGGGGSTATPTPTATPTATPTPGIGSGGSEIFAEENWVNGNRSWYTSGTANWSNNAGDPAGSAALQGGAIDGMSCQSVTEGTTYPASDFSQHAFVGIYYNGTYESTPQALGMMNPVAPTAGNPSHPTNTYEVENNQCEYNIHTHDYSGLVHIEDESFPQSNSTMPAYATLQAFLDVSGFTLSNSGLTAGGSALSGAVLIFTGTPSGKDSGGNDLVSSYSLFAGAPSSLQFSKHMAVWIVIGTPPAQLPPVGFVIQD